MSSSSDSENVHLRRTPVRCRNHYLQVISYLHVTRWFRHLHLAQVQVYVPQKSCGTTQPPDTLLNTGGTFGTPLSCQCNFRQKIIKYNVDLPRILLGIGETYSQKRTDRLRPLGHSENIVNGCSALIKACTCVPTGKILVWSVNECRI